MLSPFYKEIVAGHSTGAMMGSVITMPISGLLCQHGFAGGWGSIFYVIGTWLFCPLTITWTLTWFSFLLVPGICSMLILIVWLLLTSNTPSQHRFISKAERNYIVSSLKGQVSEEGNDVRFMLFRCILTNHTQWPCAYFCLLLCHFICLWILCFRRLTDLTW